MFMFTNPPPPVPPWRCPLCDDSMTHGERGSHKCKCRSCGAEVLGAQAESHACNEAARQITLRRQIEAQVVEAKAEMDDMPAVAALIDDWSVDCTTDLPTEGVPDEEAEARVTIESKRKWADWCREHGL